MSKRSRSDSHDAATARQIPYVPRAGLELETPGPIGETHPRRGTTRGVEVVRMDEGADRNAVMQDTILRLHQGGMRVTADPRVL